MSIRMFTLAGVVCAGLVGAGLLSGAVPLAALQMKWDATLASQNGSTVAGRATVAPGSKSGTTDATVTLTGGTAGATYPWHVHSGLCVKAGPPIGPADAYKPITIDKDGKGSAKVTLPIATPSSGDFSVNVHKSASDMGTIISCGDLKMAGM